jgi:hypothetical protein
LLAAIQENIHPESIIYSDMWRGYVNINSRLQMQHQTVNHSKEFVDSEAGTHTNTIEGVWNGFKIRIPVKNHNKNQIDQHPRSVSGEKNTPTTFGTH